MKLIDLEPELFRHEFRTETWTRAKQDGTTEQVTSPRSYYIPVKTLPEAQGIQFQCPLCHPAGKHHIIFVGFADRNCPAGTFSRNRDGKDSRWTVSGKDFTDLTLSPSIDCSDDECPDDCQWHGWVKAGDVT